MSKHIEKTEIQVLGIDLAKTRSLSVYQSKNRGMLG
jgi:hypothetical protein